MAIGEFDGQGYAGTIHPCAEGVSREQTETSKAVRELLRAGREDVGGA